MHPLQSGETEASSYAALPAVQVGNTSFHRVGAFRTCVESSRLLTLSLGSAAGHVDLLFWYNREDTLFTDTFHTVLHLRAGDTGGRVVSDPDPRRGRAGAMQGDVQNGQTHPSVRPAL